MSELGRLVPVDLRDEWANEASDFTPWLADSENISLLGETLGLDLEVVSTEANVGEFRADIVCTDMSDNSVVLIENQLAPTDHSHVGQVLTYAAGLNAVTVVWIAQPVRDEHRAAIDWLNEVTLPSVRFFAVEIELWRIGDSKNAPKFNVVSKPNDWSRTFRASSALATNAQSAAYRHQQYWTAFLDYVASSPYKLPKKNPSRQYYQMYPLGKARTHIAAVRYERTKELRVELLIFEEHVETYEDVLNRDWDAIQSEIGVELGRIREPGKFLKIHTTVDGDPTIESEWPGQFEWYSGFLVKFLDTFGRRIRAVGED